MVITRPLLLGILAAACTAAPALAQRMSFDQSFGVTGPLTLDVSTVRGKIEVIAGAPGRISIAGTVTVRAGVEAPANVEELARKFADHPPIQRLGRTVRLHPASTVAELRLLTVAYRVEVPPEATVIAVSESGETVIDGIMGAVTVTTQSGAITLSRLGGAAHRVTTGSGDVSADRIAGALSVTTGSSKFTGRELANGLRVRTSSGAIDATLTGPGDVDVETGSSAIRLAGVTGPLTAVTRSGAIAVALDPAASCTVEATSGSGAVRVEGAPPAWTVSKRKVTGAVGAGGPLVRATSRSGSIDLTITRP